MANLKMAAQDVLSEAQDAICWIACWKEGRSWSTKAFWFDFNENTHRFTGAESNDIEQLREIIKADPRAILVNGYYYNLGCLDEMTRDSLTNALRWHYEELMDAQVSDALISLDPEAD